MNIYRAYYESRNFDFEAFSQTKAKAVELVKQALQTHTEQYHLEEDWWEEMGIECASFKLNQPYRDRSEI